MSRVLVIPRGFGQAPICPQGFSAQPGTGACLPDSFSTGPTGPGIICPPGFTPVNPSGQAWECWPPGVPLPPANFSGNFNTPPPLPDFSQASISNVSRPGQSFQVGDSWSLVISGRPGEAVTGAASQNGLPSSTSNMGTTDANGHLTLTGVFGAGDVGSWTENYLVGANNPFATVSFTVAAAPVQQQQQSGGGGSTSSAGGGGISTSTTAPIPATGFDLSFLTNSISILGFNVPVWALIAAGGGLLLMSGGRKR